MVKKFSTVEGHYYPENPERNYMAYHQRISFIIEDFFGHSPKIKQVGGGMIPREAVEAISLHVRKAVAGFLANPKKESYPILIRRIS